MGKRGNGEGKAGKSMSAEGVNFVRQLAKVFPPTGHAICCTAGPCHY